jgi:hypothetical protein
MVKMPLSDVEFLRLGFNYAVKITREDFAAGSGNTLTLPVADVFKGVCVRGAAFFLKKPFDSSDATLVSITGSLGDGGSATRFLAATELCVDGTEVEQVIGNVAFAYGVTDTIDLFLTGTAAKVLSTVNDGELWILLQMGSVNPGV